MIDVEHMECRRDMRAEIERLRAVPETIAKMIEGFTPGQIRMAAGEMSAQEMRTVQAVQRWWVSAIRHKAAKELAAEERSADGQGTR
jgi:hypothetical protein